MTIDQKTLKSTGAAFDALDLEAENEQLAALAVEIVRLEKAKAAAEQRCNEIGATLREQSLGHAAHGADFEGERGEAVADALLADVDPTEAAEAGPSIADLEREREGLMAGRRDLHRRITEAQRDIAEVKASAKRQAAELAGPLAEALIAEARDAATRLVDAYVSLRAVAVAVGGGAALRGERMTEGVVAAIYADPQLLPRQGEVAVPEAVLAAVRELDGKGPALKLYLRDTVPVLETAIRRRAA
jgi:hypothetical protein